MPLLQELASIGQEVSRSGEHRRDWGPRQQSRSRTAQNLRPTSGHTISSFRFPHPLSTTEPASGPSENGHPLPLYLSLFVPLCLTVRCSLIPVPFSLSLPLTTCIRHHIDPSAGLLL